MELDISKFPVVDKRKGDQTPASFTGKLIDIDGEEMTYFEGLLHSFNDQPARKCPTYEIWYSLGKEHRENGLAHIKKNESGETIYAIYRLNGDFHRIDGPAVENFENRVKEYYIFGRRSRIDGPSQERYDENGKISYQEWFLNGQRHNSNGPAIITDQNHKRFYIFGNEYSEPEFQRLVGNENYLKSIKALEKSYIDSVLLLSKSAKTTGEKLMFNDKTKQEIIDTAQEAVVRAGTSEFVDVIKEKILSQLSKNKSTNNVATKMVVTAALNTKWGKGILGLAISGSLKLVKDHLPEKMQMPAIILERELRVAGLADLVQPAMKIVREPLQQFISDKYFDSFGDKVRVINSSNNSSYQEEEEKQESVSRRSASK